MEESNPYNQFLIDDNDVFGSDCSNYCSADDESYVTESDESDSSVSSSDCKCIIYPIWPVHSFYFFCGSHV